MQCFLGRKSMCYDYFCFGRAIILIRDRESDRSNDFAALSDDNGAERRKSAREKGH